MIQRRLTITLDNNTPFKWEEVREMELMFDTRFTIHTDSKRNPMALSRCFRRRDAVETQDWLNENFPTLEGRIRVES